MHNVNFNKKQSQHEANHGGVCYAFQNHMRPDPDCAGTLGKPSSQSDLVVLLSLILCSRSLSVPHLCSPHLKAFTTS